jgi:hypothetical protein
MARIEDVGAVADHRQHALVAEPAQGGEGAAFEGLAAQRAHHAVAVAAEQALGVHRQQGVRPGVDDMGHGDAPGRVAGRPYPVQQAVLVHRFEDHRRLSGKGGLDVQQVADHGQPVGPALGGPQPELDARDAALVAPGVAGVGLGQDRPVLRGRQPGGTGRQGAQAQEAATRQPGHFTSIRRTSLQRAAAAGSRANSSARSRKVAATGS